MPLVRLATPLAAEDDTIKTLVGQIRTKPADLVMILCPEDNTQHDRMRQQVWEEIVGIVHRAAYTGRNSERAKASAANLEECLLLPLHQKEQVWPKLLDLCNDALLIRDEMKDGAAHYELAWKAYTNDDGTDDESKEELAVLKDKQPIVARIEVREKASRLTNL
jgi:hypothetical protein